SNASASMLRDLGHETVPRDHPLTVTIPGCVDGLIALAERFGSQSLSRVLEPAITAAREGFPVSSEQARAFATMVDVYVDNPAVSSFYPDREPVTAGDVVTRADLARTLESVAAGGREAFYQGEPGADIVSALEGFVTAEDLEANQAEWVDPINVTVGQDTAWMVPPNSAGYLGPGTLAVFARLDPPDDPRDPLWWHLLIEAHRALAWERDLLVSDPRSARIPPQELLSEARLNRAAGLVSRAGAGFFPSRPTQPTGTAFMCVADEVGTAVSIINSNYRGTGSPFGAAQSGFLLHDRGAGFSLEPGHPAEMLPGMRPAHTLSPTLWTRGETASWIIGTRGGEIQPQLIAQLAARLVISDQPLSVAQAAPRWSMTEYGPQSGSSVSLEPGTGIADALRHLGHQVNEMADLQPGWGPMSVIDRRRTEVLAAADPRVDTATALVF
ncbi:MAG: gamma-glutamyltransferase family protein, partial [Acidimicrobiia bacterium]|nr:gamma-glutamyltransferase family protein [Acidimicrobiia bacterium]